LIHILTRIAVNAVALAVTAYLLPGIHLVGDWLPTLVVVAVVFGLVNAVVKPLVALLTCPLVILSLGLFVLVINGLMLRLTATLSGGRLVVDGWIPAILGGIVMALVSMALEGLLGVFRPRYR
jgi:putative membrane protein